MDLLQKRIDEIYQECLEYTDEGRVADYIPELSRVDKYQLGFYAVGAEFDEYYIGAYDVKFTIQSVAKVLIFICAILDNSTAKVLSKVTVEPTSSSFNSIVNLELENENRPLNPFINSGAIVCTSLLKGTTSEDRVQQIISLMKRMCDNQDITYNESVYLSEKKTGARNRSLAYYMSST
ncbi:MAG: glutaminase, partial [Erysipelotrichales bacterium]